MLQRERFRGLYGLFEMKKKGIFGHVGGPAATSTRAKAVQTERQAVKGIAEQYEAYPPHHPCLMTPWIKKGT